MLILLNLLYGWFGVLHVTVYNFDWHEILKPSGTAALLLAVLLVLRPTLSWRWLAALVVLQLADAVIQVPMLSNHTILRFFINLGLFAALFAALSPRYANGLTAGHFMQLVAPCMRAILIILYFFSFFHKLNTGFFDPATSCLGKFIVPYEPLFWLADEATIITLSIYGFFLFEIALMVCLLTPRFRRIGVLGGIVLHIFLGTSLYTYFSHFSAVCMMLHLFFFDPGAWERFAQSRIGQWAHRPWSVRLLQLLALVWVVATLAIAYTLDFMLMNHIWLPTALLFFWFAWHFGHKRGEKSTDLPGHSLLVSRAWGANIIVLLFIANALSPYTGLKNAQSLNMFSNLRTEAGRSNHLLLDNWQLFPYLDTVVYREHQPEPFATTLVQVLSGLRANPERTERISFTSPEGPFIDVTWAQLAWKYEDWLPPRWLDLWMTRNFPVPMDDPATCQPEALNAGTFDLPTPKQLFDVLTGTRMPDKGFVF